MPFAIVGDAPHIRDLLCGPQDHNEHCKGWRWFMYCQDDAKRWASVEAELRKMHSEEARQQRERAISSCRREAAE